MKFKVIRQHIGDRTYMPGETREAAESDVRHLIGSVLARETAAAPAPSNKAEAPPKTKSEGEATAPEEDGSAAEQLATMKKAELLALAEEEGIAVDHAMNKATLIEAILAARAAKDA